MNELSAILNNLNKFTTAELETLVQKFPYFQQGHLLLAKKYQQEGNAKFDQQLQLAALYTHDRELLYNLFKDADTKFTEFKSAIETEHIREKEVTLPEQAEIEQEQVLEIRQDVHLHPFGTEETEPLTKDEPITEEHAIISEDVILHPLMPEEVLQPAVEEQPVTENQRGLDWEENSSSSINNLIIDIEDKPEENEQEPPLIKEREVVNEYTMSPLVFNEEKKTVAIDEAPVTSAEPEEVPPVQQEDEIIAPLVEPEIENKESFSPAMPHTFDEWLRLYAQSNKANPEPEVKTEPKPEVKQGDELNELIVSNQPDYLHQLVKEETAYSPSLTKFIEAQIQRHKHTESKKPTSENELDPGLITETMAKIYEMQKKYDKAIRAYEVLILKFPEKIDTFASRIEHLKSLI